LQEKLIKEILFHQSICKKIYASDKSLVKLECGPMPKVMAALPNIEGTLSTTPQSLADAHYHSAMQ